MSNENCPSHKGIMANYSEECICRPDPANKEAWEEEFRKSLYPTGDILVINQRAVDQGAITPQQRDERNMVAFGKLVDAVRSIIQSERQKERDEIRRVLTRNNNDTKA